MQRGRLLILAASLLAAGSLLFTYFSADVIGDFSGRTAAALPVAALAAAGIVAVAGDRGDSLSGIAAVASAAAVTIALVLTGALLIDARLATRQAESFDVVAGIGAGLWVLAAASVVGFVGVLVGMSRRLS